MYYNYTLTPTASYTPHFHIFAMIILLLCSITPSSILKEMESVLPFTSAVRLFLVFDFGLFFLASINKAILNSHIVTHSFTIRH